MDIHQLLDVMQATAENMLSRTIQLNARCDALEGVVGVLALKAGMDAASVTTLLEKAKNQFLAERLAEIEKTDPGLAGRLDPREKHEEGLSDDVKFLRFDRPDQPEG